MSRGLNKVMLIGNLGSDPEIKYSPSGTPIANLSLATAENRKNKEGAWEDTTEWHKIVMFGKQAEICKDYLKKGSKIYLEGRIQTRSWEDQSGQKKYMTEVVGFNFIMLDSKGQDSDYQSSGGKKNFPKPPNNSSQGDDDLPF